MNVAKGRSVRSWCTFHWKHWAAFFNPNGIRRNLKSPSVVMIAVFSCEDSSTHTCWKACFKSTLLKTVHPTSRSLNEDNAGNGYLSSCVTVLTRRKSPHTRHDPSDFFTAWIGDAQLDSHRSMTLRRSRNLFCTSIVDISINRVNLAPPTVLDVLVTGR